MGLIRSSKELARREGRDYEPASVLLRLGRVRHRKGSDQIAVEIQHKDPFLNQVHTCNCGACIEIPNLFLEEEVTLRDHHTCGCAACIANLNSLVDRKSIAALREDHTCGCDACTENQKDLAGLLPFEINRIRS